MKTTSNAYHISGAPNVGRLQPTVDAVIEGTPMFVEDYDQDYDFVVDNSSLVGGRTGDELFAGTRIVGKAVDDSGIGDNKILRYDLGDDKFVFATATGESNLADLADVEDGTPSDNDTIKWSGAEWQFGGVTLLMVDQPIGSGFKVGTVDSVGEMVIMGVEDAEKSLTFKSQVGELLQTRWKITVDDNVDSGALKITSSSPNSKSLSIDKETGKVEMESIHLQGQTTHPIQVAGGLYFNSTDEAIYMAVSES
jgi:hypothetical protein